MYACTFAVLLQLILCITQKIPVKLVQALGGILATIALVFLYGGVIVIIAGIKFMTPENCNGSGSYVTPYVSSASPKS